MDAIRQSCPNCERMLELPADAIGRLAECPACEATFTATAPVDSNRSAETYQPPASAEPAAASDRGESFDWQSSDEHPFSVPLGAGQIESAPLEAFRAISQPVPSERQLTIAPAGEQIRIGPITADAFSIFSQRWPPLVFSFALVAATLLFFTLVPIYVIRSIGGAGGQLAAGVFVATWLPLLVTLVGFAGVGIMRVTLAVARNNSPAPMSQLSPPLSLVAPFLVGVVFVVLIGGTIGYVVLGVTLSLLQITLGPPAYIFMSVVAWVLIAAASLVAGWLFWMWPWIIADGQGTVLRAVKLAVAATLQHKQTSALVVLSAVGMFAMGLALFAVSLLILGPLALLVLAVGYLRLTAQEVGVGNQ